MDAESGGPHRAPANAALLGVADVTLALSREQQGLLSQGRVNCIEHITGHGIRVGGARTLTGNAACSYVPTARVLIAFRRWLAHGLSDIVFESLTPALWDAIRLRLWLRCFDLWQAGALAGIQESEAFSVQCDRETNPPSVQEQGQVVALVRLAPSVPAEFIDVRVVHDANGFTTSGP
jgi:phage tail sheath protein FI